MCYFQVEKWMWFGVWNYFNLLVDGILTLRAYWLCFYDLLDVGTQTLKP
jgi:hypothetical protein